MSSKPIVGERVEWMEPRSIGASHLTIHRIEDGLIHATGYEATGMGSADTYVQTDAAGWERYRQKAWETRAALKSYRRGMT
jgi:hypothetical protein